MRQDWPVNHDELSFRRPFRFGILQFRTRGALQTEIPRASSPTRSFPKERAASLAPPPHRPTVALSRFWSGWRHILQIVQPDTVIRWHRRALAWHWTRKSRRPGRPEVAANIPDLASSPHAPSQPLVGCTPHSRRTTQVGDCGGAIHGGQIFTSAPQNAFPDLANLPDESSGADRSHRFFHDPRCGNGGSAYCAAIPLAKSVCGAAGGEVSSEDGISIAQHICATESLPILQDQCNCRHGRQLIDEICNQRATRMLVEMRTEFSVITTGGEFVDAGLDDRYVASKLYMSRTKTT
jgi:hypothetical protein